jgi:hypothetical protein
MPTPRASPAAAARSGQQASAGAPAPPRWLGLARAGWAVTAVVALGILVASLPGYVRVATLGDFFGRVVEVPAGLAHAFGLAGALASLAAALVCLILAWLLFWRKPGDGMALFVSFYLLVYGIVMAGPLERLDALVPGSAALATNALQPVVLVWPTVALLALFPTGRFVPPWTRWVLLLAIPAMSLVLYISGLTYVYQWRTHLTPWLVWPAAIYVSLTLGAAGYAQVFRYRHVSSPTERQQTKWALSGLALWIVLNAVEGVPFIMFISLPPSAALPWWVPLMSLIWWLSLDIVPLTLTVALLRYRLFDIDILIRRTLVYGTLTTILGAVYFAVVLGAQSVVQALTGQTGQQPVFGVASTLLVAALFTPLRRRLQAGIDQRFYRRKYVAAQTLAAFGAMLRTETDLAQLSAQLVAVVQETMQPAHVSLWLRPASDESPGVTSPLSEPMGEGPLGR